MNKIFRKIDSTGTSQRLLGSGRPSNDNTEEVETLVLSHEDSPQTHHTQRQIAQEVGRISQRSVNCNVKKDTFDVHEKT